MKKVLVCREKDERETRVALIPDDIKKLIPLGFEVKVVCGAGLKSGFSDEDYKAAGAVLVASEEEGYGDSDIIVRIMKPDSVKGIKKDSLHLSYMDPFNNRELLDEFASEGIQAVSLEMIPRLLKRLISSAGIMIPAPKKARLWILAIFLRITR